MAKPKLALIPAAQGSKFYSVLPSDGVGDFDFARASAATRINKYGYIETVASGQSRLNYPLIDGVVKGCPSHILEPARTNYITYSEDLSNLLATNLVLTPNSAISPDGSLTAFQVNDDSTNGEHKIEQVISSATGTHSAFVKFNGGSFVQIVGVGTAWYQNFDIENGVLGTGDVLSAEIIYYGNGWYRISAYDNNPNTKYQINIVDTLSAVRAKQYEGNGSNSIFLWGAQFEIGSYPTSYIPTNGSAVTRVAETANNAGDASTFNDSEGVLMAEISALANDSIERFISISDGTTNNRVYIWYYSATNGLAFAVFNNGSAQFFSTTTLNSDITNNKLALKYKANDFAMWINGYKIATDLSGTTFGSGILNKLSFNNGAGSTPFYGNTKQIQYYDSVLTDSELETLTSWVSFQDMAEGQLYTIE